RHTFDDARMRTALVQGLQHVVDKLVSVSFAYGGLTAKDHSVCSHRVPHSCAAYRPVNSHDPLDLLTTGSQIVGYILGRRYLKGGRKRVKESHSLLGTLP